MKNLFATGIRVAMFVIVAMLFVGCRDDKEIVVPENEKVNDVGIQTSVAGFYLLNEGNMGSNKASLDYFDYETGTYTRNIFAAANPDVVQDLGDVGNDLQIYGSRLYAVINCSNLVEVMDARSARHIGTIEVPNCRYLAFSGAYAYLTSYAGPVQISPTYEQLGYVAKIDTATLAVIATCNVGFQPDEIEIVGNRIYVANSGGYMTPNYESTVSIIDIDSFTEIGRIEVAKNLHRLCADSHGQLWVSSRGDYYDTPSRLYCIDIATSEVVDSVMTAVSDLCLSGDSLFVIGTEFSYETYETAVSYGIVDVVKHELVTDKFITDGTDEKIKIPYGLAVNPSSHEIFVTDAKNYVSPGKLYCFDSNGVMKWNVTTGDIPAHFAFLYEQVKQEK